MPDEVTTPNNSLPEGDKPTDGEGADSSQVSVKDVLNKELGKEFSSDEEAIKAIKDTFSYVGKGSEYNRAVKALVSERSISREQAEQLLMENVNQVQGGEENNSQESSKGAENFVTKDQYEKDMFYSKHPEYEPFKNMIDGLRHSDPGKYQDLNSVVQADEFKSIFEKAQAYEEAEKSKSVLHSNPRLGQVKDKMSQAQELLNQGKDVAAGQAAVQAVRDVYDI